MPGSGVATLAMSDPGLVRFQSVSIRPSGQTLPQGRPGLPIGAVVLACQVRSELASQKLGFCHRYFSGPCVEFLVSLPNKG